MADTVPCPGCQEDLKSHCPPKDCGWAICYQCAVVYGPSSSIPLSSHKSKKKKA